MANSAQYLTAAEYLGYRLKVRINPVAEAIRAAPG
jgi:hypothetical protein